MQRPMIFRPRDQVAAEGSDAPAHRTCAGGDLPNGRPYRGVHFLVGGSSEDAAAEAWLVGDLAQVPPVAIATGCSNLEDTLVDSGGLVICSAGSLRVLLRRHFCGRSILTLRNNSR